MFQARVRTLITTNTDIHASAVCNTLTFVEAATARAPRQDRRGTIGCRSECDGRLARAQCMARTAAPVRREWPVQ